MVNQTAEDREVKMLKMNTFPANMIILWSTEQVGTGQQLLHLLEANFNS